MKEFENGDGIIRVMKRVFWALVFLVSSVRLVAASLVFNEFYPSPPTGEDEWLEIYNTGDTAVSFSGWQIAEIYKGSIANHEAVEGDISVPGHGFLVIIPSKLTLNNGGDTIYLINPDGEIADEVTYPSMTSTKSYARVPDGATTWEKQTPTPGMTNNPETTNSDGDNTGDTNSTETGATGQTNSEASSSAGTTTTETTTGTNGTSTSDKSTSSTMNQATSVTVVSTSSSDSTGTTGTTGTASTTNSSSTAGSTSTGTTGSNKTTNTAGTGNLTSTTASSGTTSNSTSGNTSADTSKTATEDMSWKNGIEFTAPRLDYQKTASAATGTTAKTASSPRPQVLGASTTRESSPESQLQVVPLGLNLPALIGAISGIIIGLGMLAFLGYLEYQHEHNLDDWNESEDNATKNLEF